MTEVLARLFETPCVTLKRQHYIQLQCTKYDEKLLFIMDSRVETVIFEQFVN